MRKKNEQNSVTAGQIDVGYIPATVRLTSLETDCSFLTASYLSIDGQEQGPSYDMGAEDDSGNIFNPDWDYGIN